VAAAAIHTPAILGTKGVKGGQTKFMRDTLQIMAGDFYDFEVFLLYGVLRVDRSWRLTIYSLADKARTLYRYFERDVLAERLAPRESLACEPLA
jgi:hypothetical protein